MVTLSRGWVLREAGDQGHQQGVEGSGPRGHVPECSPVCGRVFVWKGELWLPPRGERVSAVIAGAEP